MLPFDETKRDTQIDPTRREVLVTLAVCGCCAVGGTALAAPGDRAPPAAKEKSDLGPIADFADDGVHDQFSRSKQVIIYRAGDTLYASTSICSHKRCVLKKSPDDSAALKCPCHQSDFDLAGIPLGGPAKTSLVRFAISIENGHLFVDTTKSFDEKDWADPAATTTVKK